MTEPHWQALDGGWAYRGDLYELAGVRGGKVRACWELVKQALALGRPGLVTAGSRHSPQVEIVAALGHAAVVPVRAYVPSGPSTEALDNARRLGAEVVEVRPGYNGVIRARAHEDAAVRGWQHVPFGMECHEAVEQARATLVEAGVPTRLRRLVVPVGSGMSLAGLLWALEDLGLWQLPVLGVCVGAWPERRLDRWAPPLWRAQQLELRAAGLAYSQPAPAEWAERLGVPLDPVYEAKCVPHLQPGDGLWVVGVRGVRP